MTDTNNERGSIVGVYVRDWPHEHLPLSSVIGTVVDVSPRDGKRIVSAYVNDATPDPDADHEPGTVYLALDVRYGMADEVRAYFDAVGRRASIGYTLGLPAMLREVHPAPHSPSRGVEPEVTLQSLLAEAVHIRDAAARLAERLAKVVSP